MSKKVQFALGFALVGLFVASFAAIAPKAVKAAIATLIRDQDNAARRPFTTSCLAQIVTGVNHEIFCQTPAIPEGEEVVIESVSIFGQADPNNVVYRPSVTTIESGVRNTFFMAPIQDSTINQPDFADFRAGQSVRLYADPGSVILCIGDTKDNSFDFLINCTISGYSVTLP